MTGASGNVGRLVVDGLRGSGVDVRALSRRRRGDLPEGVEGVVGDLGRPQSLEGALCGVDRVFLFPVPETAERVVEPRAAREHSGSGRVTTRPLSGSGHNGRRRRGSGGSVEEQGSEPGQAEDDRRPLDHTGVGGVLLPELAEGAAAHGGRGGDDP